MEFASSFFLTINHVILTSLLLASFMILLDTLLQFLRGFHFIATFRGKWMELGTAIKFKKLCRHNDVTLRHKVNKIIPRGWK